MSLVSHDKLSPTNDRGRFASVQHKSPLIILVQKVGWIAIPKHQKDAPVSFTIAEHHLLAMVQFKKQNSVTQKEFFGRAVHGALLYTLCSVLCITNGSAVEGKT